MPQRIITTEHQWVVGATIPVEPEAARWAAQKKSLRVEYLDPDLRVDALDVYCGACHRPYDAVKGQRCEAADSNEHLRGGPIGTRAKRGHRYHDCEALGCKPTGERVVGNEPGIIVC